MSEYDLICIGSGPAGEKAATQASYFGRKVAIVERCARPGGAMVNTGTIPSKALRETALLCSAFRRRPLTGMQFSVDHQMSVRLRVVSNERQLSAERFDDRVALGQHAPTFGVAHRSRRVGNDDNLRASSHLS